MYEIQTFPVGMLQCNCSLLVRADTRDALIVDPGDDAEEIWARVESQNLRVRGLWHTHAHIDHIGATKSLYDRLCEAARDKGWNAPTIYLHEEDRWLYENVATQARFLGLPHGFDVEPNFSGIRDGQGYEGFEGAQALHTPGHTPGSCCLNVARGSELDLPRSFGKVNAAPRVVFSGDTLFRRGIGRTDLWGGNGAQILRSIERRLYKLPPDTLVIPGHGPTTRIEEEAHDNPFVQSGAS